jgi:hypothetical protein
VNLGTENRKQKIVAVALGVVALLVIAYEFVPSSSTIASTTPVTTAIDPHALAANTARSGAHHGSASTAKKVRPAPDLDPTLHLQELASAEQVSYEGSGRNIFISQPDPVIPTPLGPGVTGTGKPGGNNSPTYTPPVAAQQQPIPLKFFGFANRPGEPKKVFLIKGEDTFIAGEGEIVDRRYKVVRISPTSVDIQDLVVSGPPQSIPLTGNAS